MPDDIQFKKLIVRTGQLTNLPQNLNDDAKIVDGIEDNHQIYTVTEYRRKLENNIEKNVAYK